MAEAEEPVAKHGYDHIETYLKEPVVIKEGIVAVGGYLSYWSRVLTACPCLVTNVTIRHLPTSTKRLRYTKKNTSTDQ